MPTAAETRSAFSDEQLQELVALIESRVPDPRAVHEVCEPSEAFQVAATTRAFLASRGVDLESEQQTKTRTALEFFSTHLPAQA